MRILLDTGPLVALLNRRDALHARSIEQAGRLKPPFYSCEAVLTEAHFLLAGIPGGRDRLIELVSSDRINLSFSYASNRKRVDELMLQYRNVPISFADACLVCLAEQHACSIFTLDGDFRIYRKHRNEPLDVIMP